MNELQAKLAHYAMAQGKAPSIGKKILYVHDASFTYKIRGVWERVIAGVGLPKHQFFYMNFHTLEKKFERKGKRLRHDPALEHRAHELLRDYIKKTNAGIVVLNDPVLLGYFANDNNSLAQCRGSVYFFEGTPIIVIDDLTKIFSIRHGSWLLLNDVRKLWRWYNGKQRPEVGFDYTVISDRAGLDRLVEFARGSVAIAEDIETGGARFITCIGFTCLHLDGRMHTFVLPFVNPLSPTGAYWQNEEDEIAAHSAMRAVNDTPAYKIFHNGNYDCVYLLAYHAPPRNYLFDTLVMHHSIWVEAPKKLYECASIHMDYGRYWKDESKGEREDADKSNRLPKTQHDLERYWRYNALDCHATMVCWMRLLAMMIQPGMEWACKNYDIHMSAQVGPAFAASMHGMRVDELRKAVKYEQWMDAHNQALADLRSAVADDEFNPRSTYQVASLLYDVLGAEPIKSRGKKDTSRSTDEKVLSLVRNQHPLYARYIDMIWETKKPLNNASKYGALETIGGRFLYGYTAAKTKTGRYASGNHAFWVGTNAQNIPGDVRDMFVADPGYFFFEADYSQSDAYFVAFESEDENYIRNITDARDTHCVHAAHFFRVAYEEVYRRYKAKDPWAIHPLRGIRQLTKKVTHGANYRMAAYTLFVTMGREAVVAAAIALGNLEANLWDQKQLVNFCEGLLDDYFELYPRMREWFEATVLEAIKNGNRVTCFGERTYLFFGNIAKDQAIQREISAYFGQGGTAANINRALHNVYYHTTLLVEGTSIVTQTHDSIKFQIPLNRMDHCDKILTIMAEPCIIKGREFVVPTEAECGFSWKGGTVPYHTDHEKLLADMMQAEQKLRSNYAIRV